MIMTDLGDQMRKTAEEYCPSDESGWVVSVQCHKLVADLRRENPDLLAAWLDERAEVIVHQFILQLIRSRRVALPKPDAKAEQTLAFYRQYSCNGREVKVARDMDRDDHLFVAKTYARQAKTEAMLSAFHEAVAGRLEPGQVTSDVMTPEAYQKLFSSITQR